MVAAERARVPWSLTAHRWDIREDNLLRTKARSADRKSTRLNSSHSQISYAVFCLKKKKNAQRQSHPNNKLILADLPRTDAHRCHPPQRLSDQTQSLLAPTPTQQELPPLHVALPYK